MSVNSTPQVVSIAGSDSGGGAGLQADLKTFQNRKVFGMTVIVALTAQNTLGVQDSFPIPVDFVEEQFKSLASDFKIGAAKTGMLYDKEHVQCVIDNLKQVNFGPLVVDPVMVAKGGHTLLDDDAIDLIKTGLLPIAYVVTPNIPETEVIVGYSVTNDREIKQAAQDIQALGVTNVIIKGGHLSGEQSRDYILLESGESYCLASDRLDTVKTHGTGDTFSACIAAELAKGKSIKEAILIGKQFIQGAISDAIFVGHGHGPTNHWTDLEESITIIEE